MPKKFAFKKRKRLPRRFPVRKRICTFCAEKVQDIDYKDVAKLGRFVSERGKIIPRRNSGTCARHQRKLAQAIKRARYIALLGFVGK